MTDNEVRQLMIALGRIEEQVKGLKEDIQELTKVPDRITRVEGRVTGLEKDTNGLTSFRDWAIRLVIGAVILALLGLVLAQGGGV